MGVILRAHPVRGESHVQRNANREQMHRANAALHRCRSRQIFGGAKDFPKRARKIFWATFCANIFSWRPSWALFSWNQKTLGTSFARDFKEFAQVLIGFAKFSQILPGFSPNQNFWGCAFTPCTPASYTGAALPYQPAVVEAEGNLLKWFRAVLLWLINFIIICIRKQKNRTASPV